MHLAAAGVEPRLASDRNARRWFSAQSPIAEDSIRPKSAIRIVIFTDYQMPGVQKPLQWQEVINKHREMGAAIEVETRSYPLNADCGDPDAGHRSPAGCEAAYAVKLAQAVLGDEAARALTRWLYERGLALSEKLIVSRLAELGLAALRAERASELRRAVEADVGLARKLGVRSVPTVFVNGVRLPPGTDMLRPILSLEVERQALTANGR
jgi:protein-disulfide isomerase